ncbi:RRF domain containing protein, partial [Asbolus verrucosus]
MAVFPQTIPAALKAIQKSGMNLNPQQDGTTLFIPIPKDAVCDVKTKPVKNLKKKDKISQDVARNAELQIISMADHHQSFLKLKRYWRASRKNSLEMTKIKIQIT